MVAVLVVVAVVVVVVAVVVAVVVVVVVVVVFAVMAHSCGRLVDWRVGWRWLASRAFIGWSWLQCAYGGIGAVCMGSVCMCPGPMLARKC